MSVEGRRRDTVVLGLLPGELSERLVHRRSLACWGSFCAAQRGIGLADGPCAQCS